MIFMSNEINKINEIDEFNTILCNIFKSTINKRF